MEITKKCPLISHRLEGRTAVEILVYVPCMPFSLFGGKLLGSAPTTSQLCLCTVPPQLLVTHPQWCVIFLSCATSTAPQPSQREIKVLTDECGLEQDPASIADRVVCFCQHRVSHQPPADKINAHVPGQLQNFAEYKPRREVQFACLITKYQFWVLN